MRVQRGGVYGGRRHLDERLSSAGATKSATVSQHWSWLGGSGYEVPRGGKVGVVEWDCPGQGLREPWRKGECGIEPNRLNADGKEKAGGSTRSLKDGSFGVCTRKEIEQMEGGSRRICKGLTRGKSGLNLQESMSQRRSSRRRPRLDRRGLVEIHASSWEQSSAKGKRGNLGGEGGRMYFQRGLS